MRKTSRILGIIGSILALVLGSFAIVDACLHTFWDDFFGYNDGYYSDGYYDEYYYDGEYDSLAAEETLPSEEEDISIVEPYIDPYAVTSGASVVLGALLGILGSVLALRHNTAAGILFIVAAVLTLFSSAFIGGVLFIIAAVFALKRERSAVPAMVLPYYPAYPSYGAYPPPAQPGYPPYGAYPPPYTQPVTTPPAAQTPPAYPSYGAYPPPSPAPPPYAPQAYAHYGAYPPPPPAYGSAWPPVPAAESTQPPPPAENPDGKQT